MYLIGVKQCLAQSKSLYIFSHLIIIHTPQKKNNWHYFIIKNNYQTFCLYVDDIHEQRNTQEPGGFSCSTQARNPESKSGSVLRWDGDTSYGSPFSRIAFHAGKVIKFTLMLSKHAVSKGSFYHPVHKIGVRLWGPHSRKLFIWIFRGPYAFCKAGLGFF